MAATFSKNTPLYELVYVAFQGTFAAITCCLILRLIKADDSLDVFGVHAIGGIFARLHGRLGQGHERLPRHVEAIHHSVRPLRCAYGGRGPVVGIV
jgi:ammonia channel protein AmtB